MMLDESDRFPQHRAAHPVTLLQCLLGTQQLPDRPAASDDVGLDATRDLRSSLTGEAPGGSTGSRMQNSFRIQ